MLRTRTVLLALALLPAAALQRAAAQLAEVPMLAPPVVQEGAEPEYPAEARAAGMEGWVNLRFSVLADGKVANVEIVSETPQGLFGKAAVDSLLASRFRGAVDGARSVDWHNIETPIAFTLGGDSAPSAAFAAQYQEVMKLVGAGDYAAAAERHRALSGRALLVSELLLAEYLNALIATGMGEPPRALASLQKITPAQPLLDTQLLAAALRLRFETEVAIGRVREALETLVRLNEVAPLAQDDPLMRSAAALRDAARSDRPLVVAGRISGGRWEYHPARRILTLTEVRGRLDEVAFRCNFKLATLPFQADVEWTIPAGWGTCLVRVSGEEGASFKVVEFAPRPAAP